MQAISPLSKNDCKYPMTAGDGRQVQIAMLDTLVHICNQNGLRYFLSGGTLLGAIRHHGFIPWDDDIDVNMPRPDCEKLAQLTKGKLESYRLEGPDEGEFVNCCNWYRIYNDDTVVENFKGGLTEEDPYYHPIFIDIFPIDGLPKGKAHCSFYWVWMIFLDKMRRVSSLEHLEEATNKAAYVFHVIARAPARLIGYNRWGRAIQKHARKYSFDSCEFVGVTTVTHYIAKEKVRKKEYLDGVKVNFEGKEYTAPGNYDTYLSQLYGNDYMEMPPVEKQKSLHAFHMYWRTQQ